MNFINLATLDTVTDSKNLVSLLLDKGIQARFMDESDMQRFLFLTKPKAYSNVQVREEDYEEAVKIIQDLETGGHPISKHIFNCPECASLAVEYPQFTRKFLITPLLIEWMSNLGLFKKQFYCRKCHYTWAPQPAAISRPIRRNQQVLVAPPH